MGESSSTQAQHVPRERFRGGDKKKTVRTCWTPGGPAACHRGRDMAQKPLTGGGFASQELQGKTGRAVARGILERGNQGPRRPRATPVEPAEKVASRMAGAGRFRFQPRLDRQGSGKRSEGASQEERHSLGAMRTPSRSRLLVRRRRGHDKVSPIRRRRGCQGNTPGGGGGAAGVHLVFHVRRLPPDRQDGRLHTSTARVEVEIEKHTPGSNPRRGTILGPVYHFVHVRLSPPPFGRERAGSPHRGT